MQTGERGTESFQREIPRKEKPNNQKRIDKLLSGRPNSLETLDSE